MASIVNVVLFGGDDDDFAQGQGYPLPQQIAAGHERIPQRVAKKRLLRTVVAADQGRIVQVGVQIIEYLALRQGKLLVDPGFDAASGDLLN